ncbi:hypothetical protein J6590_081811 [Homalodisca vitripennis]|nr:hypothetical protein J6590_081811 [Homalodisca vitripennis]
MIVGGYGRAVERQIYRDHQLLRVVPRTKDDLEELEGLEGESGVVFWSPPALNRSLEMVLSPSVADDVKQYLSDSDMDYTVLNVNVQPIGILLDIFLFPERRRFTCWDTMSWDFSV